MSPAHWQTSTPPGWQGLLARLETELQQRWPEASIDHVERKHGTLRVDVSDVPGITTPNFPDTDDGRRSYGLWHREHLEDLQRLVHDHELASMRTCEQCGQAGKLGTQRGDWHTLCPDCAPDNWHPIDTPCAHTTIERGTCTHCGLSQLGHLEHSNTVLRRVHHEDRCAGNNCTIHNRSDHAMRSYPQQWSAERGIMERVCPHGVGHPDPDDLRMHATSESIRPVHGCDGCCTGPADTKRTEIITASPAKAGARPSGHLAGCLKASGNCCPWPGDCTCPCTCDQLAAIA